MSILTSTCLFYFFTLSLYTSLVLSFQSFVFPFTVRGSLDGTIRLEYSDGQISYLAQNNKEWIKWIQNENNNNYYNNSSWIPVPVLGNDGKMTLVWTINGVVMPFGEREPQYHNMCMVFLESNIWILKLYIGMLDRLL